ncbi:hypothetical protein GLP25_20070 [Photobacterium phosphoreum]|uniref:hypothetical protein n=1 Tax=Photobacterium phosphoreum TaxID=659 RepID=UPI001E51915C|nr:hypothetical protein [Photobacterium phosphoreum]MCD9485460.1 hypothetical protein [Photobacterium phosphoreum]
MKTKNVIDNSEYSKNGFYQLIWFRGDDLKSEINRYYWFYLTLIEMLVGYELVENVILTSNGNNNDTGKGLHLNRIIPSGIINNFLRKRILDVLYFKYYCRYKMFCISSVVDNDLDEINCTRKVFFAKKGNFYQLIAFRRCYDLFWLVLNIFVDTIVYFYTNDISMVLISAISIEGIRRLLKI